MFIHQGNGRCRGKRSPLGQHFKQHDACAVEVRATVQRLALGLLRTEIVRCAEYVPSLREAVDIGHNFSDAEVHDRKAVIATKHDVFRLEIAMHDAVFMYRLQRRRHLSEQIHRLVRRNTAFDARPQITVGKILHGDIDMPIGKSLIVNLDDMTALDFGDHAVFLNETHQELVILAQFRVENLHH